MKAMFANIRTLRVDGAAISLEPPSAERLQRSVFRVLDTTALCAWATVTAEGHAHISTGYFAVSDGLQLYLLSHPGSLHCRNVMVSPSMAVAVFASAQNWTDPGRGIQLFGTCAQAMNAETPEAERVYGHRFSAYPQWKTTLKAGDPALDYRFYRFVAGKLKVLDEAEFGDAVFVEAEIVRM